MFVCEYASEVGAWEGTYQSGMSSTAYDTPANKQTETQYVSYSNSGQEGATYQDHYIYADLYNVVTDGTNAGTTLTYHIDGFSSTTVTKNGDGATTVEFGSNAGHSGTVTFGANYAATTDASTQWELGQTTSSSDPGVGSYTGTFDYYKSTFTFQSYNNQGGSTYVTTSGSGNLVSLLDPFHGHRTGPIWQSGTTFASTFEDIAYTTTDTTSTVSRWTSAIFYYFDGSSVHTDRLVTTIATISSTINSWKESSYFYNNWSQGLTTFYWHDPYAYYVYDSAHIPQYDRFRQEWLWVSDAWQDPDTVDTHIYRFSELYYPLGDGEQITMYAERLLTATIWPLLNWTAPGISASPWTEYSLSPTSTMGFDAAPGGTGTTTAYSPVSLPMPSATGNFGWASSTTLSADGQMNTSTTHAGTGLGWHVTKVGTIVGVSRADTPAGGARFLWWIGSNKGFETTSFAGAGIPQTFSTTAPVNDNYLATRGDANVFWMAGQTNIGLSLPNYAQPSPFPLAPDAAPWSIHSIFPNYLQGYQLPPHVAPEDPIYVGLDAPISMPFHGGVTADYPFFNTAWTRCVVGRGFVFTPYRFFYQSGSDTSGLSSEVEASGTSKTWKYSWQTNSQDSNLWELHVTSVSTIQTGFAASDTSILSGSFINTPTPVGGIRSTILSLNQQLIDIGDTWYQPLTIGGKYPMAGSNYSNTIVVYGIYRTSNTSNQSGYETFCVANDNTMFEEDDLSVYQKVGNRDCIRISNGGFRPFDVYASELHPFRNI